MITTTTLFTVAFVLFFLFRYTRLVVNIFAFVRFTPRTLRDFSAYTPDDVTFVMPTTFSDPEEVTRCLKRIESCSPGAIIVITANHKVKLVDEACAHAGIHGVLILGVSKLNKRRQMLKGLEHVQTAITFFVDDDVYYPSIDLPKYLLRCFDDPKVGAAGPRQRARRNASPSIWNFLGICYLERRNFNTGATNHLDGGVSTLSGRTQAIRTSILKNKEFYTYFRTDSFLGRPLAVDDDKALTRFIYSRGWDISLNFHDDCTLETTFEDGPAFLHQCVRWARGHWRGNLIVMTKESYWYRKHPWTLYAVYAAQFQSPALLVDGALLWLLRGAGGGTAACALFALWLVVSKTVKLVPHLVRHPRDVVFLPVALLFSYLHGAINLYALCTTHKTIWGGRATGVDEVVPEDLCMPADMDEKAARPGVVVGYAEPGLDSAFMGKGVVEYMEIAQH